MIARCIVILLAFVSLTFIATAQVEDDPETADTLEVIEPDSTFDSDLNDPNGFNNDDEEFEAPRPTSFIPRSGLYGGPTIEFTALDPAKLDPELKGDLVLYGGQGHIIINGWLLGGGGWGATLYDISPAYDEFSLGFAGFLIGYDFTIVKPISFRADVMIGGGGLNMIKKRPDLMTPGGKEILERYRNESFFGIRPGASIGFSPLAFFDLRLGVNYLYPVGGEKARDLKNVAFGLQMLFGIGN